MFRALSVRNYRLYATGQVVSTTGTWMARVAQDWLVYHILTHDNSFALGFVTALQFLPALFLGMYGGILGDRYPKRRILMCTQTAMGAISLLSGILIATHAINLWAMCVIALTFGIATALDNPVRQAFVVEMVGRETLSNAVSLNSATFNVARMIGPAVAGLVIEAFGTAPAFFCNAVSYVAVLWCLTAMKVGELHAARPVARARGQLREGLAYVRSRPQLLMTVVLIGLVATFGFKFQITNALIAQGTFGRGAGSYGMLSTMQALGSVAGALIAARRRTRPRFKVLIGATLAFAVCEFTAALMPTYLSFMLVLVPTGFMAIFLSTACNTTLQLGAAPHMQGRVMALYMTVFMGSSPIGSLAIGWIGGALGPRWPLFFGGAIAGAAAIGCAIIYARSQRMRIDIADRPWRSRIAYLDDPAMDDGSAPPVGAVLPAGAALPAGGVIAADAPRSA